MARSASDTLTELVQNLAEQGLLLERLHDGDDYEVRATDDIFAFQPVLTMPAALLVEYVEQLGDDSYLPLGPLSLTTIHLVEELETDHHGGRNYVRALGFRRSRGDRVELFVEKDVPPVPYLPPDPDPDLRWEARRPGDG